MPDFSERTLLRYDRQIRLDGIGLEGQERLTRAKVLVVGAGGLGGSAIYYLAAAGVGTLGVADGDVVDLSNLQRQILHTTADLGGPKTRSALDRITALNPGVSVNVHPTFVSAETILDVLGPYDFVIDATDTFAAKFLINDACVLAGKAYSHGGVVAYAGQTMTVHPRKSACYRCLFEELPADGVVDGALDVGVLGPWAGTIGAIQASEAIKHVCGVGQPLTDSLLTLEALTMSFRKIGLSRNPRCPVCSAHPTIMSLQAGAYRS